MRCTSAVISLALFGSALAAPPLQRRQAAQSSATVPDDAPVSAAATSVTSITATSVRSVRAKCFADRTDRCGASATIRPARLTAPDHDALALGADPCPHHASGRSADDRPAASRRGRADDHWHRHAAEALHVRKACACVAEPLQLRQEQWRLSALPRRQGLPHHRPQRAPASPSRQLTHAPRSTGWLSIRTPRASLSRRACARRWRSPLPWCDGLLSCQQADATGSEHRSRPVARHLHGQLAVFRAVAGCLQPAGRSVRSSTFADARRHSRPSPTPSSRPSSTGCA